MTNLPTSEKYRKENEDYKFRDDLKTQNGFVPVELIPSGFVIQYGVITISEDGETLTFDYDVLEGPEDMIFDDTIKTQIGDIIVSFLMDGLERYEKNEDGNNHPTEPNKE